MKHSFSSAIADGADASVVRPSDWNAIHIAGITSLSANTTLDSSHDIVLVTTSTGTIAITLPDATANAGRVYCIKKVDSGSGSVAIGTTASQTIDGGSSYNLINQYQYITVASDGANWLIIANN